MAVDASPTSSASSDTVDFLVDDRKSLSILYNEDGSTGEVGELLSSEGAVSSLANSAN